MAIGEFADTVRGGFALVTGVPGVGRSKMVRYGDKLGYTLVDCDQFGEWHSGKFEVDGRHIERLARSCVSCTVFSTNLGELMTYHSTIILLERPHEEIAKDLGGRKGERKGDDMDESAALVFVKKQAAYLDRMFEEYKGYRDVWVLQVPDKLPT
jgi:hypothetical protein